MRFRSKWQKRKKKTFQSNLGLSQEIRWCTVCISQKLVNFIPEHLIILKKYSNRLDDLEYCFIKSNKIVIINFI